MEYSKQYLTKKEAAELTNIGVRTIEKRMKDGDIPFIKVGRLVRFDRNKIIKWMDSKSA